MRRDLFLTPHAIRIAGGPEVRGGSDWRWSGLNASFAEQTPMGRMAEVHEIAGPVLFLLGSTSCYITATDLLADGGFTAW